MSVLNGQLMFCFCLLTKLNQQFAWCDRPGECARANHGIGITEAGAASFVEDGGSETEYDFGYDGEKNEAPSQSYSLNLWIR